MHPILNTYKKNIVAICKSLRIKQMYVFGSMAKNSYDNSSDIDLLISFEDDITNEEYSENYFTLHHKLRELINKDSDSVTVRILTSRYYSKKRNNENLLMYER